MSELKWPSEEEVRKMFAKKEGFGSDATLSAAMELPEVRALTHAVASQLTYMDMCGDHGDLYNRLKAALAAIKEPKL